MHTGWGGVAGCAGRTSPRDISQPIRGSERGNKDVSFTLVSVHLTFRSAAAWFRQPRAAGCLLQTCSSRRPIPLFLRAAPDVTGRSQDSRARARARAPAPHRLFGALKRDVCRLLLLLCLFPGCAAERTPAGVDGRRSQATCTPGRRAIPCGGAIKA